MLRRWVTKRCSYIKLATYKQSWQVSFICRRLCGNSMCFAKVAHLRTDLWTDLSKTLHTTCFGRQQNTTKIFLGIGPQKIGSSKTAYFWWLRNSMATLRANISGEEHDIDNRETTLETTQGPLSRPEISRTLVHWWLKIGRRWGGVYLDFLTRGGWSQCQG